MGSGLQLLLNVKYTISRCSYSPGHCIYRLTEPKLGVGREMGFTSRSLLGPFLVLLQKKAGFSFFFLLPPSLPFFSGLFVGNSRFQGYIAVPSQGYIAD